VVVAACPVCRTLTSTPACSCRVTVVHTDEAREDSPLPLEGWLDTNYRLAVVEEDEGHLGLESALSRAAVRLQVVKAVVSARRHGLSGRQCNVRRRSRTNSGHSCPRCLIVVIIVSQLFSACIQLSDLPNGVRRKGYSGAMQLPIHCADAEACGELARGSIVRVPPRFIKERLSRELN
jgi:hypothetical protein